MKPSKYFKYFQCINKQTNFFHPLENLRHFSLSKYAFNHPRIDLKIMQNKKLISLKWQRFAMFAFRNSFHNVCNEQRNKNE